MCKSLLGILIIEPNKFTLSCISFTVNSTGFNLFNIFIIY